MIAYRLKEHANSDAWEDIIVALNSRKEPAKLTVPEGKYTVCLLYTSVDNHYPCQLCTVLLIFVGG